MVTNFCPRKDVVVFFFQIHLKLFLYTKTSICIMIHGKEQVDQSLWVHSKARSLKGEWPLHMGFYQSHQWSAKNQHFKDPACPHHKG